jgi:hypothetical protein
MISFTYGFLVTEVLMKRPLGRSRRTGQSKWKGGNHAKEIKNKVKFRIVAANNHYAGFGSATANTFRKMLA